MIIHGWNVWAFKFIFSSEFVLFLFLGFNAFLRPCALYGLALLACYAFIRYVEKHFHPDTLFYRITNSPCPKFVILRFLHRMKTHLTFSHFFALDFSLDFHVVNKFIINHKNLPKQSTYSIHVNKINARCIRKGKY